MFFLPPLLGDDSSIVRWLVDTICWQAGYDMGQGIMDLCWICLEICLELPKSHYLVSLYSNLMDQFKDSMITSENSSAARESSRVITLKSHLNSTGHSARTSETRDIFDHQTPCTQWLMTADVLARSPTLTPPQLNDSTCP